MTLGRGRGGDQPRVRLDDNVGTYDASRDGRSGEGRLQEVRLDRIDASPFQVRLVFPPAEIERLADSVLANGLIHEPRARPHPSKQGWVELMPGEMRVRALHRLVERGEAAPVLKRDGEGNWLVPVRLEPTDDDRADAMVFGENFDRTDLSAWEWAVAFQRRRDRMRERGEPSGVRDVAASMGKKAFQTVGEYLQVADSLGLEVLFGAGVVSGGQPDHGRLARLSLAAFLRVARCASGGATSAAQALLNELRKSGDEAAAAALASREQALRRARPRGVAGEGLQINIRQALGDLAPRQARHYLVRLVPAVAVLAKRAAAEGSAEMERIAAQLSDAAGTLREPDGE
ncbi:MAG TPA: ParB N-terminal domain-containing protein [Longimicrobium sp.]